MSEFKVWGIKIKDEIRDGKLFWNIDIHNPFQMVDGKFRYGINERIVNEAMRLGVQEFIVKGNRIRVPSKKGLKLKIKNGEFETKQSLFEGSPDYRIYYFII